MLYSKNAIKFPSAKEMRERVLEAILQKKNKQIEDVKNDIRRAVAQGKYHTNYFYDGRKSEWDEIMEYFINLGYKVTFYTNSYSDYFEIRWDGED